jgi:hypothetical protein
MPEPELIAKSTAPENQSDGIVVSFASDWYEPLIGKKFRAVIRKRVPKTLNARWLYFHINAPVGAICGRAEIQAVCNLTLAQAKAMSAELALSPTEIANYVGDDPSIGCYKLGRIAISKPELGMQRLAEHMVYHAPQSFFILAREAKVIIDRLAGFDLKKRK